MASIIATSSDFMLVGKSGTPGASNRRRRRPPGTSQLTGLDECRSGIHREAKVDVKEHFPSRWLRDLFENFFIVHRVSTFDFHIKLSRVWNFLGPVTRRFDLNTNVVFPCKISTLISMSFLNKMEADH
jgi:hypothetical protein